MPACRVPVNVAIPLVVMAIGLFILIVSVKNENMSMSTRSCNDTRVQMNPYNTHCTNSKVYTNLETALKERVSADNVIFLVGVIDGDDIDLAINLHVSSVAPNRICNIIYITTDADIFEKTQEYDMPVYFFDREIRHMRTGDLNSPTTNEISKIRLQVTHIALQMGYSVLLTNPDTFFVENPVQSIDCKGQCDIALHQDSNYDVNTGFIFVKPTESTLKVYANLIDRSQTEDKHERQLFNELYRDRENVPRQWKVKMLSPKMFCMGGSVIKKGCVVFQTNNVTGFENKKKELVNRNMWKFGTKDVEMYRRRSSKC